VRCIYLLLATHDMLVIFGPTGEWTTAMKGFETVLELTQGRDKPSMFLISFMKSTGGIAPRDWDGSRAT